MWKLGNGAYFERKLMKSPAETIYYACSFLRYWAGLQNDKDKKIILEGAKNLQEMAMKPHRTAVRWEMLMIVENEGEI
jgi:hypothetical protein